MIFPRVQLGKGANLARGANVVDPSPGGFFPPTSQGEDGWFRHRRQHAHGPSESSAPLRGGSVQCAQKTAIHTRETIQGWGSRPVASFPAFGQVSQRMQGYSLSYVNSGITVADIAASSTAEPRSAGSRRHCTVWEVHCTLAGVDRVIRVNTTAQL